MSSWCLIKKYSDKFKKMLISGEVSPDKLNSMSSKQRQDFFAKNFGVENAKEINALFESKLLLKNQKEGMISWAKTILKGNERQKSSAIKKINDLKNSLDKKEMDDFFADLVEKKIGFQIDEKQFKELSELGKEAENKKQIALSKMEDGKWKSEADKNKYGIDFGSAKVAFDNLYSQLAEQAKGKDRETIIQAYKNRGVIKGTWVALETSYNLIAENSRAFVASFDNSFWGRQGRKAISRPATSRLWYRNFIQSFKDAGSILVKGKQRGNEILDAVKTEIYSRENYLNGRYEKGKKLDIGIREEEFPTSLPEKILVLGRLFKISEITYTAGAMRLRADIADTFYKMAEKTGADLKQNKDVGAINEIVNIMTGRGSLGSFENAGKELNKVAFSAKFVASQFQTVSKVFTAKTSFARKQAIYNLLSLVASTGLLMAVIKLLFPDRVETDTRSTNFGKIRIGNNWVDITGGFGSYIVLEERIRRQAYKNTYTGVITNLNDGYGTPDATDLIFDFFENKTSPIASVFKDLIKQKTFDGDRPTIFNETRSLLTPIIFSTATESYQIKKNKSDVLLALIADGLGFSVSSYVYQTNWNNNTSKELLKFKEEVGDKKFKEANKRYNDEVSQMYLELAVDEKYQKIDNDKRIKEISKRKDKIKSKIIRSY